MVAQWVKRPIAYSAGIRFSGEFTSVLAVKIWVEFDLSGSLCHSGGSYRPLAAGQPLAKRSVTKFGRHHPRQLEHLVRKLTLNISTDHNGRL